MGTTIIGILIPFVGTTLGAACVYLMKGELNVKLQKSLTGFAAGVMVAASVWSLLIPAMDMAANLGKARVLPAAVGFILGILFLLLLDHIIPHLHTPQDQPEGPKTNWKKNTMLILAVTIHNIPEGMAVGVVFAGMLADQQNISLAAAFALSIGIAIQNFPEGAIISMPLRSSGIGKHKAFISGTLSGIVEPVAAVLTLLLSRILVPVMPYLLAFAAGAMIYVVVEELIPEGASGRHSNHSTIGFAVGFVVMMLLDVLLS
ncbi:ZIP family metal transporter [Oscillospiraceae bacterium HV4-5-C5C]|nr:ZIP family metal transporter [Oscillospiraceae bacterium HV4-5-C5C]